jgi:hypothetical protein
MGVEPGVSATHSWRVVEGDFEKKMRGKRKRKRERNEGDWNEVWCGGVG